MSRARKEKICIQYRKGPTPILGHNFNSSYQIGLLMFFSHNCCSSALQGKKRKEEKKRVQTDCYSNEARARSPVERARRIFPVRVMCHDAYILYYAAPKYVVCVYIYREGRERETRLMAGRDVGGSSGHGVNLALSMLIRSSASQRRSLSSLSHPPEKKKIK